MAARKNDIHPADMEANAPEGVAISDKDVIAARSEGAKDAVKEAAKDSYKALTDGALPGAPPIVPYMNHDESQRYAYLLEYNLTQFQELVAGKADYKPDDTQVYGLLNLERNGQNRTPYVKAMMDRLKLEADALPGGGPAYTNDLTNITEL